MTNLKAAKANKLTKVRRETPPISQTTDTGSGSDSQSTLPFWEDESFRQAAKNFLDGLWADGKRRAMFKATMETIWRDYKTEARYEELRQALSDAARRNTSETD